ncbi:MAG TPA: ParB/RepB/Spo0J family partition protein [Acidimicrobiales bacterium]|nr:ParB/RepB/Spo0J family partition protein [Acidimicrobiales bacterium]
MARRSGLGRGLGALIPPEVKADSDSVLRQVPVSAVEPNPNQPRAHFDEESLASLTDSIRALGVLQPILVRAVGTDRFELIAGERRWRASRRAGLQTIPALVRTADDRASLEQALVENLHRQDLNPLEEAGAYQQLIEDFQLTHDEVAQRVGRSRTAVTNTLRLLQLPAGIQKLVADHQLSAGHARALLGTPDRAFQEALARRAVAEGLSVRVVEEAVRARGGEPEGGGEGGAARPRPGSRKLPEPGVPELEGLLSDHLQTTVKVEMGPRKGRVIIDFADLEDLERIYRLMVPGS